MDFREQCRRSREQGTAVEPARLTHGLPCAPTVRHVAIGCGYLLAVTILIGPNRSTTIGLPLASLPCTP
jgi:hypothetical protein